MHELSIANALVDELTRTGQSQGAIRIVSAVIRVGALSGVDPSLLQRAFEAARASQPLTIQTAIRVEEATVAIVCITCGREGAAAATNDLRCVDCGSLNTQVLGGNELLLLNVQMDVPVPA